MRKAIKHHSALTDILLALVPYSRQNLTLSFNPSKFFNELERTSGYHKTTLRAAYCRGEKRGLINGSKPTKLTKRGFREIKPYVAKKLAGNASLMVIFDIPEEQSSSRTYLRRLLKGWDFQQVQKSVWSTNYDYQEVLVEVIAELKFDKYVQLFECSRIFPYK